MNREGAEAIARKLVPIVFRIEASSGSEGRLFGSVTASDIVDAVSRQSGVDSTVAGSSLTTAIKTLGLHEVGVRLHPGRRVPSDLGGSELEPTVTRPCGGDTAGCNAVGALVRPGPIPLSTTCQIVLTCGRPKAGRDTCPRFVHRIFLEFPAGNPQDPALAPPRAERSSLV